MIEIINLFFVPFITLYIVKKRKSEEMAFELKIISEYAIYAIEIAIISFLCMKITGVLFGIDASTTSQVYTVVSSVIAFVMPYIHEIIQKYIKIRLEVNERS